MYKNTPNKTYTNLIHWLDFTESSYKYPLSMSIQIQNVNWYQGNLKSSMFAVVWQELHEKTFSEYETIFLPHCCIMLTWNVKLGQIMRKLLKYVL